MLMMPKKSHYYAQKAFTNNYYASILIAYIKNIIIFP